LRKKQDYFTRRRIRRRTENDGATTQQCFSTSKDAASFFTGTAVVVVPAGSRSSFAFAAGASPVTAAAPHSRFLAAKRALVNVFCVLSEIFRATDRNRAERTFFVSKKVENVAECLFSVMGWGNDQSKSTKRQFIKK
jgi:hypothetical protein